MGDHSVHGHAEKLPEKQEEVGSAMQNIEARQELIDGELRPIYHIQTKELDLLLRWRDLRDDTWVAVTPDILPMQDIPQLVERVMKFEDSQERQKVFELLYSLCDESADHGTFPDLTRIVCKNFLQLPSDVSCKALPLLINFGFFNLFVWECKPHYAEILDWVSSMPVANQKQFWVWARAWDETFELLRLFHVGEWKQLFAMIEVIQPEFATHEAFNAWVAELSIQISNVCEKTAKLLLHQYAGDLAADMLDWLVNTDQAKFKNFDASLSEFELRVHNNLPTIKLDSIDGFEHWFRYAVLKKIDNVPWSVQNVMQFLFQCADDQEHSKFLFDWLKRLDFNHRETRNLIQWKCGCAWVIAELLQNVIQHKRGLYCGLHNPKRKHEAIYTDESEEQYRKRLALPRAENGGS